MTRSRTFVTSPDPGAGTTVVVVALLIAVASVLPGVIVGANFTHEANTSMVAAELVTTCTRSPVVARLSIAVCQREASDVNGLAGRDGDVVEGHVSAASRHGDGTLHSAGSASAWRCALGVSEEAEVTGVGRSACDCGRGEGKAVEGLGSARCRCRPVRRKGVLRESSASCVCCAVGGHRAAVD